jgi:hypothetical protein
MHALHRGDHAELSETWDIGVDVLGMFDGHRRSFLSGAL